MNVTEAERERVLRELRERYAGDELTPEEFDARVTAALAAESRSELTAVVPRRDGAAAGAATPTESASPRARGLLEQHLAPDEWIEWAGAPDPTKHTNRGDVFLIPFSIAWGGFAIFWEGAAIVSGQPFFIVWGLAFVVAGLYMMVGRFFYKEHRRRRTVYAVTNRRVMSVVQRHNGAVVEAKYLRTLSSVSTTADSRGYGSIRFDPSGLPAAWADSGMGFFDSVSSRVGLCFFDVDDAPAVAALVERLRAAAP